MSINSVAISGNLCRDADLRATQSGTQVLRFTVAVNERKQNKQTGEWENVPNYVDCTLWGTRAEKLSQYLTKGTKVAVLGKLHFSAWEKNGEKHNKLDVNVSDIELLSRGGSQQSQQQTSQAEYVVDVYDAEIPF